MLRPPPAGSIWGRDIWLRWYSGDEPRPPYMPPPLLFTRSAGPVFGWGVKCRQFPPLLEPFGLDEFPGRGTLLDAPPRFDVPPGDTPEGRFIAPLCCAEFVSENRRHPSLDVADLPVRSACTPEGLLNPPLDGVRTPGVGLAIALCPAPVAPPTEF